MSAGTEPPLGEVLSKARFRMIVSEFRHLRPNSIAVVLGVFAAVAVLACDRSLPTSRPPAVTPDLVLIVTVDSLRWDMLGAYGDESGVSPTIDDLADQAHVFTYAYATSSWTKPSIASLLTASIVSHHLVFLSTLVKERAVEYLKGGVESDHERMYLRGNVLPSDLPLIHEFLDGHLKAAFVENVHLRPELGFARGWDEFRNFPSRKSEEGIPGNAAAINHDVLEFLDVHKNQRAVVWIHYFDVHWPYGPFEPYGAEFLSDGADLLPDPYTHEGLERLVQGEHDPDGLVAKTVLPGIYRAGVREFDERLGQLFDQLRARGLFDASLIILTSDHGDEFFEHGQFGHGNNLYDTTVRIPLLIKLPGQSSGQRHSIPASLVDIGPTILEVCGKGHRDGFDGSSLLPAMRGESSEDRRPIFELVNPELENMKGMVSEPFKAIFEIDQNGPEGRIFKLDDDSRALDPTQHREDLLMIQEALVAAIGAWDPRVLLHESVSADGAEPREIENVDEIIEQLRAIGYVQ